MAATVEKRFEPDPRGVTAHIEGADTFGAIYLISTQAQQVNAHFVHIKWHLASGLNGVGVKEHAVLLAQPANLLDRLQRTDLVIGRHDTDQDRLVGDGSTDLTRRHLAVFV